MADLPDLTALAAPDERLREQATDVAAVEAALAAADAALALALARAPAERARLEGYRGNALRLLRRHREAVAAQGRSLAHAEDALEPRRALVARIRLGEALRCADDLRAAERELRQAVTEARGGRHPELLDFALQHLGKTLLDAGARDEAVVVFEEALALREEKGDPELVRSTALALGRARGV